MRVILISSTNEPTTGWGTMTHHHCLALARAGISFTLLKPPFLPRKFNFHRLPDLDIEKDTIIHSILDFPYAVLGWRLAKKYNLPFVFTAHGTYSVLPFTRFFDRQLFLPAYRGADKIIAVSNFTAKKMQEISGYQRPIDVIHNPVAVPAGFGKEDFSILDKIPKNKKIILAVGPSKGRKGIDILQAAMPLVTKEVPNAYLMVVSGNLPAVQLAALFSSCDVFALTPRYINHEFEGYGLVYLEAGLYKKPVVGSRSGGVPEAVIDGETGLLVPENDPQAAAEAIVKILKNPDLAKRLGEGGYRLAKERNWDSYITKVIGLYEKIL